MIAREGWPLIITACTIGLILSGGMLMIPGVPHWIEYVFTPVLLPGLGLMVAWFFRDPERIPPPDHHSLILAPADGKVLEVVKEEESLFIEGQAWRVSIFLSVLNVHVNRIPVSGVVHYRAYQPGKFRVAWHPKSSRFNEQSHIGVQHSSGTPVLFKQIAGRLARRIIFHLDEGDQVEAGKRFGLIQFGSRMDLFFPAELPVQIKVGDRVQAGVSLIAPASPPR